MFQLDGHVILAEPVGVEDGPGKGFVDVDIGEVLQGDDVEIVVGPLPLLVQDKTVLKQAQPLVSPNAHQT